MLTFFIASLSLPARVAKNKFITKEFSQADSIHPLSNIQVYIVHCIYILYLIVWVMPCNYTVLTFSTNGTLFTGTWKRQQSMISVNSR